jgi:hypothetical protein
MINIDRFDASKFVVPIQGTIHDKIPEQAHVSKVELKKGPEEEKIMRKTITDEEKTLIHLFKSLAITDGWDRVTEKAYENRHKYLSKEMSKHYEDLYRKSKLKDRIMNYLQREKRASGGKGTSLKNDNFDE